MKEVVLYPAILFGLGCLYIWIFGQVEIAFGNVVTQWLIIISSLVGLGVYIEYCKRH